MTDTPQHLVLWPMITLVAITFVVAVRMFLVRIGEMRARKIPPQSVATSRKAAECYQLTSAADNFKNLFELPVLFYALCIALLATDTVTPAQVAHAWLFVMLRAAHSTIQLTYNRVIHRFAVYIAGLATLAVMWVLFALELLYSRPV